jgi:DNA repair protein RecO (recombination protein O)
MRWQDQGVILSGRPYGEGGAVVHILTAQHGHWTGLVRSRKKYAAVLQPGTQVEATWNARLSEHLGMLVLEPSRMSWSSFFDDSLALLALSAACSLCEVLLPEREAVPSVYTALLELIAAFSTPQWPAGYVRFECHLLAKVGYGLDLARCGATGNTKNLLYVSPRTGRAISAIAGAPYEERLLPLPSFLRPGSEPNATIPPAEILKGLDLTQYFLERHVFPHHHKTLPEVRVRLRNAWEKLLQQPKKI